MSHADLGAIVGESVVDARAVRGGDVNDAYRCLTASGLVCFVKTRPAAPVGMYAAEAAGLGVLAAAGAPVPDVVAVRDGHDADEPRGLALEWLEGDDPGPDGAERLGRDLAALHTAPATGFGFDVTTFIGPLPQDNEAEATWAAFYAERRLRPWAAAAAGNGSIDAAAVRVVERVTDRLDALSGDPEPPALLHGDLWGGNVVAGRGGEIHLVDPAAYHGHREVDLAMMRLFGGFSERTFDAYREAAPLASGAEDRVGLWQMYPLLVHAVLFGGHYGSRVAEVAARYS